MLPWRALCSLVWVEAICPEGNPYVNLEGQIYMRGADGKLMPAKKGQKPPDLQHFNGAQKPVKIERMCTSIPIDRSSCVGAGSSGIFVFFLP